MPGIHRQDDSTTGHGCYPPTIPSSWSPNVYCNGKPVVRVDDTIVPHGCAECSDHESEYVGTNKNVYVNSRMVQYCGAPIACGDSALECSGNVFVGV